jgi:flavodoxin
MASELHPPTSADPDRVAGRAGPEHPLKRYLVVCYSRSGCTRRLAEVIAQRCDADLELIEDRDARKGPFGWLRSAAQALLGHEPRIRPPRHAPRDYALVIIGTPVWACTMASPVRTWIDRYGARCRRMAFFCTCGSVGGAGRALIDMQQLAGRRAWATLALQREQVARIGLDAAVEPLVRRLNGQRAHTAPGAHLAS